METNAHKWFRISNSWFRIRLLAISFFIYPFSFVCVCFHSGPLSHRHTVLLPNYQCCFLAYLLDCRTLHLTFVISYLAAFMRRLDQRLALRVTRSRSFAFICPARVCASVGRNESRNTTKIPRWISFFILSGLLKATHFFRSYCG